MNDSRLGRILRANVTRVLGDMDLKPSDLYEVAGITRSSYSRLFKTPNGPQLATVEKLASVLGVTLDELLKPPLAREGDGDE